MNIIDLTHEIDSKMPVYRGDKNVELYKTKDFTKDGFTNYLFCSEMHSGTHIDGPMHLTQSNKYISEIDINNLTGKGKIIDVSNQKEIFWKSIYSEIIKENDILILYTGYSDIFDKPEYFFSHPVLTNEFCEEIIKRKIKLIGFDMPSPDNYPFLIHKKLLESNIFIVENLTNLKSLLNTENFFFMALPLKIKADSSFVRSVAIVDFYG